MRGLSIELNLTCGEEGEDIFSITEEHIGIRDLGFVLVTISMGENRLIIEFILQSIMPHFQCPDVLIESL